MRASDLNSTTQYKRSSGNFSLESDDDFQEPQSKRMSTPFDNAINPIKEDIAEVRKSLDQLVKIDRKSKIPTGLKLLLVETFKCKICHQTMVPPVIVTKCCKALLGCDGCINGWFSGEEALTKSCPACSTERGYNETMILRGLDDFLVQVKKCVDEEEG